MSRAETVALLALLLVIAVMLGGCLWYLRLINHNVMVAALKVLAS